MSEHLLLVVSSLTVDVLYGVGLWAILIVVPAVVMLMKGQNALFAAGLLLLGLVWAIAAFRLFYGPDKLKRSVRRYGDVRAP